MVKEFAGGWMASPTIVIVVVVDDLDPDTLSRPEARSSLEVAVISTLGKATRK